LIAVPLTLFLLIPKVGRADDYRGSVRGANYKKYFK